MREMTENILALAFVTYLFTFFNILIDAEFMIIERISGEFILNIFIVLVLVVIIKTTVDILNMSKPTKVRIAKKKADKYLRSKRK